MSTPTTEDLIKLGKSVYDRLPRGVTAKEAADIIWNFQADKVVNEVMSSHCINRQNDICPLHNVHCRYPECEIVVPAVL